MQKNEFLFLVVDDDAAMGKSMVEAITRAGFRALHALKPDEALALMKIQQVNALVVDCMLPKMNGRDLAKKFREELGPELPIFFVSGIYKDKSFARDAIQSVGAKAFFTKPFDITNFISTITEGVHSLIESPMSPLQSLLVKKEISSKERVKMINQSEQVHGFDLPLIYSLLMHPKVSGHLNMVTADNKVSGVGFSAGRIIQVNQEDTRSYFGSLLVESGFTSQAEIEDVIKAPGGGTHRIGERLVAANVVSPHAILVVLSSQQGIRLSQTVADTSVRINFIETTDVQENANTDRTGFTELTNEWLSSKLTLDWLKSFYLKWAIFNIEKGPDYSTTHRVFTTSALQRVPGVSGHLLEAKTLEVVLARYGNQEDELYRALHALIVARVLRFGEPVVTRDYEAQKARLEKLVKALAVQTHFERLGVSQKAKEAEIKRAYHELAKILHPDKLGPTAPPEVRALAQKAFEMVSTAHSVLSETRTKEVYLIEMERGRADQVLAAEQIAEQAPGLLSKGDIRKAREILEEAIKLAPPSSDTRVLYMWARLKTPGVDKDQKMIAVLRDDLAKVPPEDRHNGNYLFVKALLQKVTGELDAAKRGFEHCVSMYPESIDARRELAALNNIKKDTNILNGDLKDVVGLLFKKKK